MYCLQLKFLEINVASNFKETVRVTCSIMETHRKKNYLEEIYLVNTIIIGQSFVSILAWQFIIKDFSSMISVYISYL